MHSGAALADQYVVYQSREDVLAEAGITGFVDLHCHLLPALDDGPAELLGALRMSERALRSGTRAIVATPHSNHRFPFSRLLRDDRIAELRRELKGQIEIFAGCEVELSPEGLTPFWADPGSFAVNAGRYVLVEAPRYGFATALETALPRLAALEMQPILAHPERLRPDELAIAVDANRHGLLLQVTAAALTSGLSTRIGQAAWRLLERGLVDFVASDAHDSTRRPPDLAAAFQVTAARVGPSAAADLFVWNPLAVLSSDRTNATASATSGC